MKLRIGFTIEAEALFGLMAKMLPLDDLHVEELGPGPRPKVEAIPHVAKVAPIEPERTKPKRGHKRAVGRALRLDKGLYRIVLDFLADGQPHAAVELKPTLKAAGYSQSSVASTIAKLRNRGLIFQPEPPMWQIVRKDGEQAP